MIKLWTIELNKTVFIKVFRILQLRFTFIFYGVYEQVFDEKGIPFSMEYTHMYRMFYVLWGIPTGYFQPLGYSKRKKKREKEIVCEREIKIGWGRQKEK